jgi:hypothetical protein
MHDMAKIINMLVITDTDGTIIGAAHDDITHGEMRVSISPGPGHKLHRIADVPEEIANLKNAEEFHKAITKHFNSKDAKVSLINPSPFYARHSKTKK